MRNVLLIEDSSDYRENIELMLADDDHVVTAVPTPHDAFGALSKETFDVIICDLHLPFMLNERISHFPYSIEVGIRTINELRNVFPDTPIVAISASLPVDFDRIDQEEEFVPLLSKPFSKDSLLGAIERSELKLRGLEQ